METQRRSDRWRIVEERRAGGGEKTAGLAVRGDSRDLYSLPQSSRSNAQGYSLRVTRWWPLLVVKGLCGPVRPEVGERLVRASFSEQ